MKNENLIKQNDVKNTRLINFKKRRNIPIFKQNCIDEKVEFVEFVRKACEENGIDEKLLEKEAGSSESSVKRVFCMWVRRIISGWTTIFEITRAVCMYCKVYDEIIKAICSLITYILGEGLKSICYEMIEDNKAIIVIEFKCKKKEHGNESEKKFEEKG